MTHVDYQSVCVTGKFICGSEMRTTVTTAPSINTQQLIYVNGSYQLVERLEEMLASKTKAVIDECHFIKAFISP